MLCVVIAAVLALTVTGVDQVVASVEIWRLKSRVLSVAGSPPAPACLTTNLLTCCTEPRSTCSQRGLVDEQNLSLLPPVTLPLKAFCGPSVLAQAAEPVAGLFNARFTGVGWGAV